MTDPRHQILMYNVPTGTSRDREVFWYVVKEVHLSGIFLRNCYTDVLYEY